MDTSYLAQQVNSSIGQLHGLFDEIGVPSHEREERESELFAALREALSNQVEIVNAEKKELVDEAKKIITTIRQMEASLDDSARRSRNLDQGDLKITYPLVQCLQGLREKQVHVSRLHKERYEQVKKLAQALESYSSHLEPTFVQIALPPTEPNASIPPSFDLSPSYVDKLDAEFTRVYEEYTHRIETIQSLSEHIIQLWVDLGTPQSAQDSTIVKYYRDAPEQLGLHQEDIAQLKSRCERLSQEKRDREKRLQSLKAQVEALWEKLGVDEHETKQFLNANRGCGMRQINEFAAELERLNELKHEHLHVFVEDARDKLQQLWDSLYFSEDEMLEFTPAWSEVWSDALLEAHEREIARLEALKEERAPTLALLDRHRSLIKERDDLQTSSQDASRLMARGQKGEKRDPGKLLREEKMRKRIAKELPKVAAELRKMLEKWEDEYDRPFLVYGERYLDEVEEAPKRQVPGARSKTPAGPPSSAMKPAPRSVPTKGPASAAPKSVPPRSMTKTPTAGGTIKRKPAVPTQAPASPGKNTVKGGQSSPSRIPARAPLSNLKHGNNSPERPRPESRGETLRSAAPISRAPPPKMRDLVAKPELETPANPYKGMGIGTIVRPVEPEDVYADHPPPSRMGRPNSTLSSNPTRSNSTLSSNSNSRPRSRYGDDYYEDDDRYATLRAYPQAPPPRQISSQSHASTTVSGSENWETYDDNSEPEPDASDAYYAKLRAARNKRQTPDYHRPTSSQAKRAKGVPPTHGAGVVMIDQDGQRIISQNSAWTDEDVY